MQTLTLWLIFETRLFCVVSLGTDVVKWLLYVVWPHKTPTGSFRRRQIYRVGVYPHLDGRPAQPEKCLADIAVILEQCLFCRGIRAASCREAG
ncbi:hypothetical protein KCP78_21545 [Salmonella enterica subsp. enterica]|nr:hypothetical protein KCP78_21545 [Salmonella enterica subsp. enterica]